MSNYELNDDEFRSFLNTLGTRIKLLRKSKGIQMRDIMIRSGYYDAQWRKYEAGGSLNLSSLMKIALTLDVTLTELLDGLGQWPKLSVAQIQMANPIVPDSVGQVDSGVGRSPVRSVAHIHTGMIVPKRPTKAMVKKVGKQLEVPPKKSLKASVRSGSQRKSS